MRLQSPLVPRVTVMTCLALAGACSSIECPAGYEQVANRCLLQPAEQPPAPPGVSTSAGGGSARSERYAVRLSIGSPAPMGDASSASYRLQAGPGGGAHD